MSNVPTEFASEQIGVYGPNALGDMVHFVDGKGNTVSWIDAEGHGQGNLSEGAEGPAGPTGVQGIPGPTGPTGAPGTTNLPYFDAQTYGATPKTIFPSAGVGTVAGGSLGTLALVAALDFVQGSGIAFDQGGPAPSGSAFTSQLAAPTVSVPANAGTGTVNYVFIPADSKGGLGQASLAAQTTSAPAHFGALSYIIASANQSGTTLTVTTTGNMVASINDWTLISYFTGADAAFNGLYQITAATNTGGGSPNTVFTVTLTTSATLTGVIGGNQTARLVSDVYTVSAASRNSSGVIAVTTTASTGVVITASPNPSIAILSGVLTIGPDTHILEGQYRVITGTTGTLVNLQSALTSIDTAINLGPQSLLTVWNYIKLALPATSGTGALKYWVYADYANTGNYVLVGSTLPNQTTFIDYGNYFRQATGSTAAFVGPSYVPSTLTGTGTPPQPTTSNQNQLYSGQITAITGTTASISPSATAAVTAVKVKHDDGYWLLQAINAAVAAGGGTLVLSPGASSSAEAYHINYPLTIPQTVGVQQNAALIINETVTTTASAWVAAVGPQRPVTPQFSNRNYGQVSGIASPLINNSNGGYYNGLSFTDAGFSGSAGQTFFQSNAFYLKFEQCSFQAAAASTIPLVYAGIGSASCRISDCDFSASGIMPNTYNQGQPPYHPHFLPAIWMKGTDQAGGTAPGNILFDGQNSMAGRGILLDLSGNYTGPSTDYYISVHENQQPVQPMFMMLGGAHGASEVYLRNVIMDSSTISLMANWSTTSLNWVADTITMAGTGDPILTGDAVSGLRVVNSPYPVGQTNNFSFDGTGSINYVYAPQPPSAPIRVQAFGLELAGNSGAVYGQPADLAIASTSTATTGGSIVPGTYLVTVSAKFQNGGEGAFSAPVSVTVPAGTNTNTITVTVTAAGTAAGIVGYYYYIGNQKQTGNSTTNLSNTFTTNTPGGGNMPATPQFDGGGIPMLDTVTQAIYSPAFSLVEATFKSDIKASVLSANRTVNAPDGAAQIPLAVSFTTNNTSSQGVTVQGATTTSKIALTPTNAAAMVVFIAGYTVTKSANTITFGWTTTSSTATFDLIVTAG